MRSDRINPTPRAMSFFKYQILRRDKSSIQDY
jgi:hypothetical protein